MVMVAVCANCNRDEDRSKPQNRNQVSSLKDSNVIIFMPLFAQFYNSRVDNQ
jgi:hypothetical protein